MKRCAHCGRDHNDDSLNFCLDDGAELFFGPASDEPATAILGAFGVPPSGGTSDNHATLVLWGVTADENPQSELR